MACSGKAFCYSETGNIRLKILYPIVGFNPSILAAELKAAGFRHTREAASGLETGGSLADPADMRRDKPFPLSCSITGPKLQKA